jgi:hypothetical protein
MKNLLLSTGLVGTFYDLLANNGTALFGLLHQFQELAHSVGATFAGLAPSIG